MIKLAIFLLFAAVALADKPLYGTPECKHVLAQDCSGFPYEPVCVHNGHTYTTYDNSCLFAQGICSHHGHSVTAESTGPCQQP